MKTTCIVLAILALSLAGCGRDAVPSPSPIPEPTVAAPSVAPSISPAPAPSPAPLRITINDKPQDQSVPLYIDAVYRYHQEWAYEAVYVPTPEQREELRRILRFDEWVVAGELPDATTFAKHVIRGGDGHWGVNANEDHAVLIPFIGDADGVKTCYFAPLSIVGDLTDFIETMTPLPGEFDNEAEFWLNISNLIHWPDVFRHFMTPDETNSPVMILRSMEELLDRSQIALFDVYDITGAEGPHRYGLREYLLTGNTAMYPQPSVLRLRFFSGFDDNGRYIEIVEANWV